MKKIKPVLPSLREKKRYLVFEIISKDNFKYPEVKDAIWNTSLQNFGRVGLSKFGLKILHDKYKRNTGIIKVNNKKIDEMKFALMMIKEINKTKVVFRSLGVSGILKKAEQLQG